MPQLSGSSECEHSLPPYKDSEPWGSCSLRHLCWASRALTWVESSELQCTKKQTNKKNNGVILAGAVIHTTEIIPIAPYSRSHKSARFLTTPIVGSAECYWQVNGMQPMCLHHTMYPRDSWETEELQARGQTAVRGRCLWVFMVLESPPWIIPLVHNESTRNWIGYPILIFWNNRNITTVVITL